MAEPATCRLRTSLPLDVNASPGYSPTRDSVDCEFRRRYAVQPPSPSPNRPTHRPRPQDTEDAMDKPIERWPRRDILRQYSTSTLDPPNPIPPPRLQVSLPAICLSGMVRINRLRTHWRVAINECISVNLACSVRKGKSKLCRRGSRLQFGKLRAVWPNRINATGAREFALAPPPMGRCRPDYSARLLARLVLGDVRSGAARAGGISSVYGYGRQPRVFCDGVPICSSGSSELRRPTGLVRPSGVARDARPSGDERKNWPTGQSGRYCPCCAASSRNAAPPSY